MQFSVTARRWKGNESTASLWAYGNEVVLGGLIHLDPVKFVVLTGLYGIELLSSYVPMLDNTATMRISSGLTRSRAEPKFICSKV